MKTQNEIVQKFIDFLETNLCRMGKGYSHPFTKVGPRSFFYADAVDTIFVKVSDRNLIIITDGYGAIDQEFMYGCPNFNGSDLTDEELHKCWSDGPLQDILHLF